MSWNHRVLVVKDHEDLHFMVKEVYYDENGVPGNYGPVSIAGESLADIRLTLEWIRAALDKPVLWGDEKFPEIFDTQMSQDK